MFGLIPRATLRACASTSSTAPAAVRFFSSTPAARAADDLEDWDVDNLEDFAFDDATSLGHLRLMQAEEERSLVSKLVGDEPFLREQGSVVHTPPKGKIRVTSTIDLSVPDSPYHQKRVLVAPVAALPLTNPEAVHRFKLLAGPRWTPGFPGRREIGIEAITSTSSTSAKDASEGWIKIAEERFPEGPMNRKSVSDMLEGLVEAANDKNSPIPADTPLDPRHLLARQRKKRNRASLHHFARAEALKRRPEIIGGVRGFPKEWLPKQKE